jgi:hypothetical protein
MHPILSKIGAAAKWLVHTSHFDLRRGRIISLWAAFEISIDRANSAAWNYSGKYISTVVPKRVDRKIELFERIHRELLPFKELQAQAAAILADYSALQDDRNWLVHGAMIVSQSRGDYWTLEKGDFPKGTARVEFIRRRFTDKQLSEIERRVGKLGLKVARYASAIAWKLGHEGHKDMPS